MRQLTTTRNIAWAAAPTAALCLSLPAAFAARDKPIAPAASTLATVAATATPTAGIISAPATTAPTVTANIIPAPAEVTPRSGQFHLTASTRLELPAGDRDAAAAAAYLDFLLMRAHLPRLRRDTTVGSTIRFVRDATASAEGYTLEVDDNAMTVSASSSAGLFYGAVTAWQLLTASASASASKSAPAAPPSAVVAAMTIHDAPAYVWRGLMLDSVRHFQRPVYIKSLLDTMAVHKLNVLQWHLTDDQGWRVEIRRYPKLTSIASHRAPAAPMGLSSAAAARIARYGGYYTQAEIRDIVAYATARHIVIVPEIEMPGHAQAAVAAYPALGVTDANHGPLSVSARWGVHTHLFNVEPETFDFLEHVLAEIIDLFPGPYVHVGGDEAVKDEWNASPQVRERMRLLGVRDAEALQTYFVQRVGRYLEAHHRRLVGWDEILQPGLNADAVVMSWHGSSGAQRAAATGNDTILSPDPSLYLDHRQSELPTEPPGRLSVLSLHDVYAFDPRLGIEPAAARHVLGLQANLWTEHVQTESRAQWMTWPRAAALAEIAWSPAERQDWPNFLARVASMLPRYRLLDIEAADSAFGVAFHQNSTADSLTLRMDTQSQFGEVHYRLDGGEPTASSPRYTAPLTVPIGAEIRAASFAGEQRISRISETRIEDPAHERLDSHQLESCTSSIGLLLEPFAGRASHGQPLALDVMNPCWLARGVDLAHAITLTPRVAPLPFNFEIGKAADSIRVGDNRTPHGEFEVHVDGCTTPVAFSWPLPDTGDGAPITLPARSIPAQGGTHDLCLRFARPALDPMWALDSIEYQP